MNHLSASSIDTFLRCPQQWAYRYVDGLKRPPSIAIVQGSSLHKAAEHNYAYKVETHEDLPTEEVLDVCRDAFLKESEAVEDWEDSKPSVALDETIGITTAYQTELAPSVQPVHVEREIVLTDDSWRYPILGYTDVEDDSRVIDIKTAGKKKSQSDLDSSLQGGIYLLHRHRAGLPENMDWHVAVKAKTPSVQVISRQRVDHVHTVRFVARVQEAIDVALKSGVFAPALPGSWHCSERFCGYWSICECGGHS
jgi:RecB family exonuclease